MTTISSKRDLRNWTWERIGPDASQDMIDEITAVLAESDRPRWGSDWSEFLDDVDLMDIYDRCQAEGIE